MFLKDSRGEQSATFTILWVGFSICLLKFALSEHVIRDYQVPRFSGTEFATALAALGALYQSTKIIKSRNDKKD